MRLFSNENRCKDKQNFLITKINLVKIMEKLFIIVLSIYAPEILFVKYLKSKCYDSLTFMRSFAYVFNDFDEASRVAYNLESSGNFPSGTSFHVVKDTSLW